MCTFMKIFCKINHISKLNDLKVIHDLCDSNLIHDDFIY
jgi:hypothetical protein